MLILLIILVMGVQLLESAKFVNFIDDRIDTSQNNIPLKAIIEAFHAPSSNGSGANDTGPRFRLYLLQIYSFLCADSSSQSGVVCGQLSLVGEQLLSIEEN